MSRIPEGSVSIQAEGDAMLIEYRWPKSVAQPNLIFGGILLAAALFAALVQHAMVPCVLFVIIGAGVTYNGLKLNLNTTRITAAKDRISVVSGPILAGGRRSFPTEGIEEFFVASPVRRPKSLIEVHPTIFLTDANKAHHRLTDAVPSIEIAAQIRHALLDYYNLPDTERANLINLPIKERPAN